MRGAKHGYTARARESRGGIVPACTSVSGAATEHDECEWRVYCLQALSSDLTHRLGK